MDENYYEVEGYIDPSVLITFALIGFVLAFIGLISQWRIFSKAGQPGWAILIPIYNLYVLLKVVGKPGWWILMMFIPLVNIYFGITTVNLLSKSFGKDVGFTLGLLFLPFIFFPILAFGGAKYQGPYGDPAAFAAYQNQNKFEFEKASY